MSFLSKEKQLACSLNGFCYKPMTKKMDKLNKDYVNYPSDIIFFNCFDENKRLAYTPYNFDFIKYKTDRNLTTTDEYSIIYDFLGENGFDFNKPYTVKEEFKKYFTPITQEIIDYCNKYGYIMHLNYMTTSDPITFVDYGKILEDQFKLVYYTDQDTILTQDYMYINPDDKDILYTKWNFDFDTYSNDFKVWGSKMFVFTDFVVRCVFLSGVVFGTYGYGLVPGFEKYFDVSNMSALKDYISRFGITTCHDFVSKSVKNIDWVSYYENNKVLSGLTSTDVEYLKNHFYTTGQFEIIYYSFILPPLTNGDLITNSLVSIVGSAQASGFLFNYIGDPVIYMVTCYHVVKGMSNLNIIRGTVSVKDNDTNSEPISVTAEFKVIGYDTFCDILVSYFEPILPYNRENNIDLSIYPRINVEFEKTLMKKGDDAFYVSHLKYDNNYTFYRGNIMDSNYSGSFEDTFIVGPPDSLLLDIRCPASHSGTPIFIGDPTATDGVVKCVGMVNGNKIIEGNSYVHGINGLFLRCIISNIIGLWDNLIVNITDIVRQNFLMKTSLSKRWLGIYASYFNRHISTKKYPVLNNLPYTGGLLVEDFIVGFDYNKKKFITNALDLSELNVIKLDTPLLKTKIYERFLFSSKTPIVIKSIEYFNNLLSEYKRYYFGKYGEQMSYSNITYGILPVSIKMNENAGSNYFTPLVHEYIPLKIEYYFYDGSKWVLEEEIVGGNDSSWYNTYTDLLGNVFYQHKFVYPQMLLSYLPLFFESHTTFAGKGESIAGKGESIAGKGESIAGSFNPFHRSHWGSILPPQPPVLMYPSCG